MKKSPEEKEQDRAVAAFFEQAVKDGQMTREEMRALDEDEDGRGHEKSLKTFDDFIITACHERRPRSRKKILPPIPEQDKEAMRQDIDERLALVGLTRRDVELFINYPEHTEAELATAFGLSPSKVNRTLAKVRKTWPSLRLDTPVRQRKDECPSLDHMQRIECTDTSDWLDIERVRQKF